MSFLAPFYLAGLIGISLPILLHLIRRSPQGRQVFSSLMFLTPSPPRITRRSRLENLLLLLLRAAALILLAVAFARPFLRSQARLDFSSIRGRRIAVLLDTSASMRRPEIWTQAQREVEHIVQQLESADHLALIAFDDQPRMLTGWELEGQPDASAVVREQVRESVRQLAPGWKSTDLGAALAFAADVLVEANDRLQSDAAMQVIVVSDLQQGARLEALQAYDWPASVRAEFRPMGPRRAGNAALRVAQTQSQDAQDPDAPEASGFRLRVSNSADAQQQQFRAYWADATGPASDPVSVQAPAGQTRVVSLPKPPARADRVVLEGDGADFDNVFYFAPRQLQRLRTAFWMEDAPDDPQGLRYYVERALATRPERQLELIDQSSATALTDADLQDVQFIVARDMISTSRQDQLRRWVEAGGVALLVLSDPADAVQQESLAALLQEPRLQLSEAQSEPHVALSEIDFQHPVFARLANPHYSDFTQLRFWSHRRLEQLPADVVIPARFDNGDPALVDCRRGAGHLFIMTAGWRPDESQLARSSAKFIPILEGIAGLAQRDQWKPESLIVGQPALLPPSDQGPWIIGDLGAPSDDAAGPDLFLPQQPGLYRARSGSAELALAVNLDGAESETAPRDPGELEPAGVQLGLQASQAEEIRRSRHLRDVELEGQQKVWRWLLAAALGLLIVETWLAGRTARQALRPATT